MEQSLLKDQFEHTRIGKDRLRNECFTMKIALERAVSDITALVKWKGWLQTQVL